MWDHLELPAPTPVQNDLAKNLQHGERRLIVCAFRGVGKSWITVAFVLWLLLMNPNLNILVVSANEGLAKDFIRFCRQLIDSMPMLQHLRPLDGQIDNALAFDVGPKKMSKDASVRAAGITGQITGGRADVIVSDDVEVPKNSYTHVLRERLGELVKEYDAVLKPGGRVVYLGTPQNESSLYPKLTGRGYVMRIWPSRIPKKPELYAGRLAPFVQRLIDAGMPALTPIEPSRFGEDELQERLQSYGISGYALQFQLDTNPSDAEKNPLKTRDLLVDDTDGEMGRVKMTWAGNDRKNLVQDFASGGFEGDYYCRPDWRSDEMAKYQGTVMAIDPSGRGNDETAYAIVRYLNGMLYLVDVGGFTDGFGEGTLRTLATQMILHKVNYWVAEENYGGGMFAQLLKPVILKVAEEMKLEKKMLDAIGGSFDDEYDGWSSTQKELRILDTLEPLLKAHRLVVDRRVLIEDAKVQGDKFSKYSFIYQMTRMSRVKGCVSNEDRLEAVSMACNYWTERMSKSADKALEVHKQDKLDAELKRFIDHAIHTTGRRDSNSTSGPGRLLRR